MLFGAPVEPLDTDARPPFPAALVSCLTIQRCHVTRSRVEKGAEDFVSGANFVCPLTRGGLIRVRRAHLVTWLHLLNS
jgi:hypothetical protein